MKFIVFGLGSFGSSLSVQLVNLGHEVIGVDHKVELVEKYQKTITHTIALDATNAEAIKQLPLNEVDAAIIGIGENEGISIMVTALLIQHNVKRIICRVTSPLQQVVYEAMNIEEFVYPEASSAERLAMRLDMPGILNSFRFRNDYRMIEVKVPERYVGKTVESMKLNEKYKLILITIVRDTVRKNIFGKETLYHDVLGYIDPQTQVLPGDNLLLFGTQNDIKSFID
ncbi:potassium channel family protein [Gynurincola endophyticus]|jgi:trk system potassium uptake protein TrkA|uniref:potassium channel family protein n=1 Tax=Gynurincola endophyticus TaxID=2479004 RepID=UPI000F8ECE7D|nr:TrkA family potassium uptake protein [Gynurincola endophyticus]